MDYKDADSCPDYDAVTVLPLSRDNAAIKGALTSLQGKVSGGCDFPENVLSGVDRALSLAWRSGVKKVVIQMGDAPGKDPEPHSGLTLAKVAAHASAIGATLEPSSLRASDGVTTTSAAHAGMTNELAMTAILEPAGVEQVVVDPILIGSSREAHAFGRALADATGGRRSTGLVTLQGSVGSSWKQLGTSSTRQSCSSAATRVT